MFYVGVVSLFYRFVERIKMGIEGVFILTSLIWVLVAAYGVLFKKETAG
jgi:hypothetical protein